MRFRLWRRDSARGDDDLTRAMKAVEESSEQLRQKVQETMEASRTLDESSQRLRNILYETARRAHQSGPIDMKISERM